MDGMARTVLDNRVQVWSCKLAFSLRRARRKEQEEEETGVVSRAVMTHVYIITGLQDRRHSGNAAGVWHLFMFT